MIKFDISKALLEVLAEMVNTALDLYAEESTPPPDLEEPPEVNLG